MGQPMSDALFLLAHFTSWVPRFVLGTGAWMLPTWLCPVTDFTLHTTLYTSILTYMAISMERYVAIVHPMRKMRGAAPSGAQNVSCRRHRRVLAVCATIWVLVSAWWAPTRSRKR